MSNPGVRRLCVVVDVEGYSRHPHLDQIRLQQRLVVVLNAAVRRAGVRRRRIDDQASGDGRIMVLPAGVDEARVVPGLLRGLLHSLDKDRRTRGEQPALRLRLALGQGVVHLAENGYVGRVVVETCRLADADAVRAVLINAPAADLALAVGDDVFRDVLVHGYGGFPIDGFRCVQIAGPKGLDVAAWLCPLTVTDLGPDPTVTAATVAGVPLGAAPLLLEGAGSWSGGDDDTATDLDAVDDPGAAAGYLNDTGEVGDPLFDDATGDLAYVDDDLHDGGPS